MTVVRTFRSEPQAVTAARLFVRRELSGVPPEVRDAAELMTSELTTNCVRHARTEFEVTVDAQQSIRIAVTDAGAGDPQVLSPAPTDLTGRGLLIVSRLASRWGVIPAAPGKTVWFALDVA
ncbi:MAG TPA: ATP-binding protein [Solirubrobacteraceae bacterium]|jgi:signal transduction histidine kinase|nr:ATP-binding protein [Solirubrobacteraceae bacterium]